MLSAAASVGPATMVHAFAAGVFAAAAAASSGWMGMQKRGGALGVAQRKKNAHVSAIEDAGRGDAMERAPDDGGDETKGCAMFAPAMAQHASMQLTERERIELMRIGGALLGLALVARFIASWLLLIGVLLFLLC